MDFVKQGDKIPAVKEQHRERLPVSVSSAVFLTNEEGHLLLLQQDSERKGYKWGPPAGGLHPNEDPMMCAIRETREEISVDVELERFIGTYTVGRGPTESGVAFVFTGTIVGGEITPRKGEKKLEIF